MAAKLVVAHAEFTHLHLHTQYSLLDGAIRLDDLFPQVLERGMKSVAITDHGNLFGALDFYETAKKHGVKPIFGCETYVAPDRHDKTERKSNHLILLAKNNVGWKNLSYLNSMGYLEGFYYNPRIDKKLLREHSEGLIGLSACLGGEVAQTLHAPRARGGRERRPASSTTSSGAGNFFLELQPNGLEEQEQVNGHLIELSKKTGIPLIATNDCHYLNQERRARARDPDVRAAEEDHPRREAAAPPQRGVLREDARRRWTPTSRTSPRRWRTPPASASCATSSSTWARPTCPSSRCPTGYDADSYVQPTWPRTA